MAGFSREVARRVFTEELRKSDYSFREGDEQNQYSPQYLLTPTGAKCNRVFLVGTLTERDNVGSDTDYWRGRIVDPTGSMLIYAGQYQPEAARILAEIEVPTFVAVVGKPKTYQTEDGSIIVSVRAEAIQKVDEAARDRWILDAAARTGERLMALDEAGPAAAGAAEFSTADHAAPEGDAKRALMHYNTDVAYYREMVIRALTSLRSDLSQKAFTPRAEERSAEVPRAEERSEEKPSEFDESPAKAPKKGRAKAGEKPSLSSFVDEGDDVVEEVPIFGKKVGKGEGTGIGR